MNLKGRVLSAAIASTLAVTIGVLAAWPIYRTVWLLVPAAVGLVIGAIIAALSASRRWSVLITAAVLLTAFVISVVPVAVPGAFDHLPDGLLRGLLDGLAASVLGWKQLLTLTLPVGSYQTMLVPAFIVFLATSFLATLLSTRAGRFASLAAFPLLFPVAFGTVFGASDISTPLRFGPITIHAPREIGLWIAAAALGAVWIWWTAGAARRAALRRGRIAGESRLTSGRALRAGIAGTTIAVGLLAGIVLAPMVTAQAREVPRDSVDPQLIVQERPSPLASYRVWKRDSALDTALFDVSTQGGSLQRLRLAVLDEYDGIDFHVSSSAAGSFTRFPNGERVSDPVEVTITIAAGYSDIWAPTAQLGSAPIFSGPRASELADAFYVNRSTGSAIAVPGGASTRGLVEGDGYRATMSGSEDFVLTSDPGSTSRIDLELMPELESWIEAQNQPATAAGLIELVKRLNNRGYLSHAISDRDGERAWIERLSEQYGTQFESSAGGHSIARIEQLFAQLNTQQRLAGDEASDAMLVAGVGDDEQFATAAALIAQALGYESRVVVGVRIGEATEGLPGIPACASECTGENLAAWIEVRGESGDWSPIDTTPQLELRPTTLEEGEQLPEFPTAPEERDAIEVDPPLGVGERSDEAQQGEVTVEASWIWPVLRGVGLGTGALVLLALPLLFIPFAKRRRTATRRAERDPELAAVSAWQEMTDRAIDAGVNIPEGAGRREVAEILNTAPARWAATQVDHAVFAPMGIGESETKWLWAAVDADRHERESQFSFWRGLRASYALRSYGVQRAGRRSSRMNTVADPVERTDPKEGQ